ncbi:hypothetical protein CcCBS67573_g04637 [Chytriomyces confervae]|uniref:Uncharacterized protein n=1 Tax=Chytriomyces confervae TaxID=246404 RepID=A0A507FET8_9FUNG|nr:hypothetical protein CcCBS67573_g04637 [Chytriomyces confervae]
MSLVWEHVSLAFESAKPLCNMRIACLLDAAPEFAPLVAALVRLGASVNWCITDSDKDCEMIHDILAAGIITTPPENVTGFGGDGVLANCKLEQDAATGMIYTTFSLEAGENHDGTTTTSPLLPKDEFKCFENLVGMFNALSGSSPTISDRWNNRGKCATAVMLSKELPVETMSARVTSISVSEEFGPLERVLITANGNVQRIISAYYNAPVSVDIIRNTPIASSPTSISGNEVGALAAFDREVHIRCKGQVFCKAYSHVHVSSEACLELVVGQKMGIGQLFRAKGVAPNFELKSSGQNETCFWRVYCLSTPGFFSEIKEVFDRRVLRNLATI